MPELPHAPRIIQGILFDLGSTLWRRVDDDRWRALEIEANARAGTLLPPDTRRGATRELSDEALGAMIRREIDLRIRGVLRQAPDWEPDFALICQQALWALAITPVERLLSLAVFEALRIRAAQSRVLFDDTLSTLQVLHDRGYHIGIVTNRAYGGELFLDDLRQMGLLAHIAPRSIAVSADRGACKPNPALFEFALAGLGLTPGAVAMVGDEIAADIWGAQRSGLYAIWRPSAKLQAQALREWQSQQSQGEAHGNGEMPVEAVPLGDLIACAQKRARARDARTATMSPPDATIMRIADLLALFPPR